MPFLCIGQFAVDVKSCGDVSGRFSLHHHRYDWSANQIRIKTLKVPSGFQCRKSMKSSPISLLVYDMFYDIIWSFNDIFIWKMRLTQSVNSPGSRFGLIVVEQVIEEMVGLRLYLKNWEIPPKWRISFGWKVSLGIPVGIAALNMACSAVYATVMTIVLAYISDRCKSPLGKGIISAGFCYNKTGSDFIVTGSNPHIGRRRPITLFLGAMIIFAGILVYFSTEETFALHFRQAGWLIDR